jgi:hypothetical protein
VLVLAETSSALLFACMQWLEQLILIVTINYRHSLFSTQATAKLKGHFLVQGPYIGPSNVLAESNSALLFTCMQWLEHLILNVSINYKNNLFITNATAELKYQLLM